MAWLISNYKHNLHTVSVASPSFSKIKHVISYIPRQLQSEIIIVQLYWKKPKFCYKICTKKHYKI